MLTEVSEERADSIIIIIIIPAIFILVTART
jgi:hypothetical protein